MLNRWLTRQVPPKPRYVSTTVHGVTFQRTVTLKMAKCDSGFTKSRVLVEFEASVPHIQDTVTATYPASRWDSSVSRMNEQDIWDRFPVDVSNLPLLCCIQCSS